ncbi:MAG TPA: tail fiber domain-containing protein [Thermoanaerobaculia bacterium]|nr:tail fiber domain-containing protein [Thermoanaerobaculia bacterium]
MPKLQVDGNLSNVPQQVKDESGNSSGLLLTKDGNVHLGVDRKLVLGLSWSGEGEWIQNSKTTASDYGVSLYVEYKEKVRVTKDRVMLSSLRTGFGSDLVIDGAGELKINHSSARFKEDIRDLQDDFHKVLSLAPVSFTYKETGEDGMGYLAEDLHEQGLRNLVSYDSEGQPLSVHYRLLPVYLLEVLKEQQRAIESLEEQLGRLSKSQESA